MGLQALLFRRPFSSARAKRIAEQQECCPPTECSKKERQKVETSARTWRARSKRQEDPSTAKCQADNAGKIWIHIVCDFELMTREAA